MAVAICALMSFGEPAIELLRYDREKIIGGQWWRLLTGHLVHASWPHTGLNVAGLVLIALLFPEPVPVRGWIVRLLLLGLGISALMYWRLPSLGWYVGLSGVLHGFFVLGFWWLFRQGDRFSLVLLGILLGKLVWEHYNGPITSNEDLVGVPVLVESHSFGAVCALIYILARAGLMGVRNWMNRGTAKQ